MLTTVDSTRPLLRGPVSLLAVLRMSVDPLIVVMTLAATTLSHGGELDAPFVVLALIAFSLTFPGTLPLDQSAGRMLARVLGRWGIVVAILLSLGYATTYVSVYDPHVLWAWLLTVPAVQYAAHLTLPHLVRRLIAAEGMRKAVVVGVTEAGRMVAERFRRNSLLGVEVVGFFDDRDGTRLTDLRGTPVKGTLAQLPAWAKANSIEAIYIALPMGSQPRILRLLDELRDTTASIYFVPDIFVYDLIQARVDNVDGVPVVAICESPFYGLNGVVKRCEDLLVSLLVLLLLAPLLAAIAVAVKLSSPGPVIFRQRRYGLDGKEIIVYKFRTMAVLEDGAHVLQARRGDPRVTPLGAFLRRTSLDELPQFVNVLQGRMSVVGPRPHAVAHNEIYRGLIKSYMIRHKVKPGITGLAQVSGARGETDTVDKMKLRIDYDLQYLRNWTLRLDLAILARTLVVLVRGDERAY